MKTALSLSAISEQLEAAGFACSARVVREAKRIIEKLKQEQLKMSHTFTEAIKVIADNLTAAKADNAKLAADNAKLTTDLAAAVANARTADEATAEAAAIALADQLDPAPTPPPTA